MWKGKGIYCMSSTVCQNGARVQKVLARFLFPVLQLWARGKEDAGHVSDQDTLLLNHSLVCKRRNQSECLWGFADNRNETKGQGRVPWEYMSCQLGLTTSQITPYMLP